MENFSIMHLVVAYFTMNLVIAFLLSLEEIATSGIRSLDPVFYGLIILIGLIFLVAGVWVFTREWWARRNEEFYIAFIHKSGEVWFATPLEYVYGFSPLVFAGNKYKRKDVGRALIFFGSLNIDFRTIPCSRVDAIVDKDGKLTVEQFNNLIESL